MSNDLSYTLSQLQVVRICEFRLCARIHGHECVRCGRVIADMTIMEKRAVLFPLQCCVPSTYDCVAPLSEFELSIGVKYEYIVPIYGSVYESVVRQRALKPLANELIGQEGGKWDRFYMEG